MSMRERLWDSTHLVHTAHLSVHENCIEKFSERVKRHARVARTEPGCLAFDVYQSSDAPNDFLLFEVYRDTGSLESHRRSAHFAAFRHDVDEWVIGRQWWYWSPIDLA